MDKFIDHVMRFLRAIGPGAHVLAVCQPAVAVLTAVALLARRATSAGAQHDPDGRATTR